MRLPHINDNVRLMQDVPELSLRRGAVGVVCSTWFAPQTRYEVEFTRAESGGEMRALLRAEQVAVEGLDPDTVEDESAALAVAENW